MIKDATQPDVTREVPPPAIPRVRFQTLRSIMALILREMTTSYGRSPGGYFWAVAQPVALIVILSVAFSLFMRSPPLGTNFVMFYATGIIPLRMFQMLSMNVGLALQFSKRLMAYPRVTFVDAILARAILAVLTQCVVAAVIFGNISIWTEVSDIANFELILEAFAMVIALGVGVGTMNCFMFMLFPVWRVIWGIVTGPLILISAVLYIYEDLPIFAQELLWFNPLVHITGLSRMGFYSTYTPTYISVTYVLACSAIPAFFGILFLRRYGRTILHL